MRWQRIIPYSSTWFSSSLSSGHGIDLSHLQDSTNKIVPRAESDFFGVDFFFFPLFGYPAMACSVLVSQHGTRDQTHALCSGSMKSQPLAHQRSPRNWLFFYLPSMECCSPWVEKRWTWLTDWTTIKTKWFLKIFPFHRMLYPNIAVFTNSSCPPVLAQSHFLPAAAFGHPFQTAHWNDLPHLHCYNTEL